MIEMTAAITTGIGYAAALLVVPAALGVIALRRIAGFPRWMEPVIRYGAAVIPTLFGIVVQVHGIRHLRRGENASAPGNPAGDPACDHPEDSADPWIVTANHVNIFDAFVIRGHLPLPLRGLELESHFRWPLYGTAMRLFGNIPLPHGSPRTATRRLARSRRHLEDGTSLLLFPEGHRTRTGAPGPFMSGPFRLAKSAEVPILPVVMTGAFERQRVGTIRIYPGVVHLTIMPPVSRQEVRCLSERALREQVARVYHDVHVRR
jgi:1-acyl-sn-glycerol-3-phosphate acyltransferase